MGGDGGVETDKLQLTEVQSTVDKSQKFEVFPELH